MCSNKFGVSLALHYICIYKLMERMKKFAKYTLLFFVMLWANGSLPAEVWAQDTLTLHHVQRNVEERVKEFHALAFRVDMQMPVSGDALQDSVDAWVESLMAASLQMAPSGPYASCEDMATHYEHAFVEGVTAEIKNIVKKRRKEKGDFRLTYTYDYTVRPVYETRGIITFEAEAYVGYGEGEGKHLRRMATFRKTDGGLLQWSDLVQPRRMSSLHGLVADGLQSFFGMANYASLCDRLQLTGVKRNRFPLPKTAPALKADGIYAFYEVGCPTAAVTADAWAIVPYAAMTKLWKPGARKLCGK